MRVIEEKMLAAIASGKNFKLGNTEVKQVATGFNVLLHGNIIFIQHNGVCHFSLAGWNTVTTKSRLRALGVDVRTRNYTTFYNGVAIDPYYWYVVK